MCGTSPAFRVMKAWLQQRKVRGEAAAELMAAMPSYLLTPGRELVREMFELVRGLATAGDGEQQLKVASVLAFSHLLRLACVNKVRPADWLTNKPFI